MSRTPVGPVSIWVSPAGLRHVEFGPLPASHDDPHRAPPATLTQVIEEMRAYFEGELVAFDFPLDLTPVTDFQRAVYQELLRVERGRVITYGQLADRVGRPEGARAVGQAVGANPIPIVIPCHRVVAADGRLGGYSGGLPRKVALLRIEGVTVDGETPTSRVRPEVLRLDL